MQLSWHADVQAMGSSFLHRRSFLHTVSAGAIAAGALNITDLVSLQAAELRKKQRAMILLFMQGGPSQLETFDPKPGTENGGETKGISTAIPGVQIANGWEETAKQLKHASLIRSLTNKEGNHERAVYQVHTGYVPSGSVRHPLFGSAIAHQIAPKENELPAVVTIGDAGRGGAGAGFLGVNYEPFHVQEPGNLPNNVASGIDAKRFQRRLGLLDQLQDEFASRGGKVAVENHRQIYDKSSKLVLSPLTKAFELSSESQQLKSRYGDNDFGRSCLLARRLVEAGVTYIEIRLNGWDTHQDNFSAVRRLAGQVDPALGTLLADLSDRGMLDSTLVCWMGEFGRTPKINPRGGRDHHPRVFNALLAGGGVKGGQVIGSSDKDGNGVREQPVEVNDLLSSFCKALQIDPGIENMSPLGRPMKIVDGGKVIDNLFA